VVDCGAVSYSLIESELFGHERGAFTGAVSSRQGAFELADGGTVFLDEIGELPLDVQPKLLRVLETREFRRVGGNKTLPTNVRVIAATKRDLQREVSLGKFREDLYFRLAVVPVTVPPLRSRREDIPALVTHMLKAATGGDGLKVTAETLAALEAHDWPGNIRELRNVLDRAVYMAQATGANEVSFVSLPSGEHRGSAAFHFEAEKSYRDTRAKYDAEFERAYVRWLLGRHHGNVKSSVITQDFVHGADYAALREAAQTFQGLLADGATVARGEGERRKDERVSDFREAMAWLMRQAESATARPKSTGSAPASKGSAGCTPGRRARR
jgi:transcriptional regulator with GAF, ATPase, and Fis domain